MLNVPEAMQPSRTAKFVSIGIEVLVTTLLCNGRRLQVAVIYRAPNAPIQQSVQLLTRLLDIVNATSIATIVLGNFNDDILNSTGSAVAQFMLEWLHTVSDAYHHR